MRNSGFKEAGLDKADHQINRATSYAQVRDQTLCFTLLQHLDGTVRLHGLFKGDMLRVVEIDDLQLLSAQQTQAALDAAPHLRTSEDASLHITVGLCCQHEVGWQSADLTEHDTDAALTFTIAIGGGG